MAKNFVVLTALVLVLSGWTWGGEKKEEAVTPSKSAAVQSQPTSSGYAWGQKKTEAVTPAKKKAAVTSMSGAAVPLRTLTSGTEEERRARIESLVRLSKAMKAKREAEAAEKKASYY